MDPTERAKTDAIGVYNAYWQQMQLAYAKASTDGTDIRKYAVSPVLNGVEDEMKNLRSAHRIVVGQVGVGNPTVTSIALNQKVPSASISSCLDIGHWDMVDQATKKKVALPPERRTKYVTLATVERWPDGWKVIKDDPQDRPC
ncbi:secreted protein/lipoprotein [Streptomyces sp. H39-S7]|uniref:secreted protein/lipoprotein n=1 Tax=Streptomyces sp. H39-S7 TaxID=3004357 RepID=UPI0022AE6815|nr:secreted protein/lipoprotein [Streptomyces sp. H39-S7]MCZ4125776.1 secreted protein/lipoprotein [Streptomyces sp. H39-S7]